VIASKRLPPIDDRIRQAFADYFETLALLREYAVERRHPLELAVLACARLDSLANLATSRKEQEETFPYFMEQYSGQKNLLQKVAIPNLYSYLARYHEMLPGIIASAGRITQFSKEDRRFLELISKSDLPVTEEAIGTFLRWLRNIIQKRYRATASQRRSKPVLDRQHSFISYLEEAASSRRSGSYKTAITAMRPLARVFSLSSVSIASLEVL
jgi:hypothetical protein